MKTIGLIGGMSWESTATYYQVINQTIGQELGGLNSAKILLYSVNFSEIEKYQSAGKWDEAAKILGTAAYALQVSGADFIVICTNTMHKIVPEIKRYIEIPVLHIAEAMAYAADEIRVKKVLLLGTKYTLNEDFYKKTLENFYLKVTVPPSNLVESLNYVIFEQLCKGKVDHVLKKIFLEAMVPIIKDSGVQGVILGCTELGLMFGKDDFPVPVFDSALIHAKSAALYSIDRLGHSI